MNVLLDPILRRTVLACMCALFVVCPLAFSAGDAQAIDQWGPQGQIDGRDGSLAQLGGVAVAPDGSAIYAVDVGQAQQTDDCGNPYTPIVVHRYALSADRHSATETGSVTLAGDLPFPSWYGEASVPIAVAKDAAGHALLLLGFAANYDANGDGICTQVTDPALLTELDAGTLAPVRTLTRAQLGGFDVERLAVAPGAGGAPDTVWTIGVPSDSSPGPSLTRWAGVPGDAGIAAPAGSYPVYQGVLPSGTGWCYMPPSSANGLTIAAEPRGTVLLDVGMQWASCADLGSFSSEVLRIGADGVAQQPPAAGYVDNAPDPLPLIPGYFTAAAPLAVDPASGDLFLGEYANGGPGIQQRHADGTLVRAWGNNGPPIVAGGSTTNPACAFSWPRTDGAGLYTAAAPGLVVAGNVQPYDATQPPGTTGPLISWFGDGNFVQRCLLTARPTASLSVSPASGAQIGGQLVLDASQSAPDRSRAIDADNALTYQFESDGAGYGPPTTDPVYHVPVTHSGTYSLGVLVTDSYGQQAEVRHDYTVAAPAPVAVLRASDVTPRVGEAVSFDASGSTGSVVRYQFDLDGSGSFATDGLSNPLVTYKFTQPGPVAVGLRVTNSQGVQDTTTLLIDVQPAPPTPPVPVPATGWLPPILGTELQYPGDGSPPAAPAVTLRTGRAPDGRGRLRVTVGCRVGGANCHGTLWLSDRQGRRISPGIGFYAMNGRSTVVRPRLSAAARALLTQAAVLRTWLEARMLAPNGSAVTVRIGRTVWRPVEWAPRKGRRR